MTHPTGTEKSWKNFFVVLTGKTNGAHNSIVGKLKRQGHREVDSTKDCDYLLVFCPAVSRVQSDIEDGLSRIPVSADKPIILVVMHHTFNPNHIVAESRRLVAEPNVHLTVDYLFFQNDLLTCNLNDLSWGAIQRELHLSPPTHELIQFPTTGMRRNKVLIIIAVLVVILAIALVCFLSVNDKKLNETNGG